METAALAQGVSSFFSDGIGSGLTIPPAYILHWAGAASHRTTPTLGVRWPFGLDSHPLLQSPPRCPAQEQQEQTQKETAQRDSYSEDLNKLYNRVCKPRAKRAIKVPDGDLTKAELDSLAPDGVSVYLDPCNCRTQVYIRPFRTISRSWDLYSKRGASVLAIYESWKHFELKTGQVCPHPSLVSEARALGLCSA